MEEDINILEESLNKGIIYVNCGARISNTIENVLIRLKELEKENKYIIEQNMMMSQRHSNDSQKLKTLDKAITYILQDLEVEKKGFSIEEMKNSYLLRAKSEGFFIKTNRRYK